MTPEIFNRLKSIPPPSHSGHFVMDGKLDPSAVRVASNGGVDLYVAVSGSEVYVATKAPKDVTRDVVIFVAGEFWAQEVFASPTAPPRKPEFAAVAAPLTKRGSVPQWGGFLAGGATNPPAWFDRSGQSLRGSSGAAAGDVVEGVTDFEYLFGTEQPVLYVALGVYGGGEGGKLLTQVPAGNRDGNIDSKELLAVPVPAPRPPANAPVAVKPSSTPASPAATADRRFKAHEIAEILPITRTMGGSVWVMTIRIHGEEDLHVVEAATRSDAEARLTRLRKSLEESRTGTGTGTGFVVVTGAKKNDAMYTFDGNRPGWAVFVDGVRVESR